MTSGQSDALQEGRFTTTQVVLFTLAIISISFKVISFRRGLKAVGYLPGFRVPFHPFSLPGALIPSTWWNPGLAFVWKGRISDTYKNNDTISLVPFLLGPPTIYTSNIDVFREVVASNNGRKAFGKQESTLKAFIQWGMNVLVANGDMWRKHRRIMGPAFNNKLYEAVWTETQNIYHEMVNEEGWVTKDQINVPVVQTLTFKLALLIIGKCGFGLPLNWSEPLQSRDGKMGLQEAFEILSTSSLISAFVPKWLQGLPVKRLQRALEAKQELMGFMREQVILRKTDIRSQSFVSGRSTRDTNAFSMLVEASENEGKFKLDDSELIGNMFIMLFAGHETTAHGIASTLAFLAVHADIQEEIYQHIISVVGHVRHPVYDDYSKLNKVVAAFFEGVRLFPAAFILIREAFEDTVLHVPNPRGVEGSTLVPVAKGTTIVIDMIGLHYNPRHFDEPEEYKPSRWYDLANSESEAFTAFSFGARACIGRKFATTEAICFLTMILKDYKIEPLLNGKETVEHWKKRVVDGRIESTLGLKDLPLTLSRRKKD